MQTAGTNTRWLSVAVVFFCFFVMGFVDIVGISTNYIKRDFSLSGTLSNMIPMMVFVWFLIFSIPAGILMGKLGRKQTVLISLALTAVAMIIPYFFYNFLTVIISFSLLGISNTILQVSLFPLIASMFTKEKTAGMMTMGTFFKAVSSFLGPVLAGLAAAYFNDWKLTFLIFSVTALFSVILLFTTKIDEINFENRPTDFKNVLSQLKNRYILVCFLIILLIVGLDVGMNTSIPELLMLRTGIALDKAGLGTSVYFAARTIGAFLGAFILLKIQPNEYLFYSLIVAIMSFLLLMFTDNLWFLLVLIFIIGFSCANVFSIIFSLALQKEPSKGNEISALMIMGISGGALILPLQGIVSDNFHFIRSLAILLICLIIILILSYKVKVTNKR